MFLIDFIILYILYSWITLVNMFVKQLATRHQLLVLKRRFI